MALKWKKVKPGRGWEKNAIQEEIAYPIDSPKFLLPAIGYTPKGKRSFSMTVCAFENKKGFFGKGFVHNVNWVYHPMFEVTGRNMTDVKVKVEKLLRASIHL